MLVKVVEIYMIRATWLTQSKTFIFVTLARKRIENCMILCGSLDLAKKLLRRKRMVKVTEEQVEFWLGSDMTKTEMIECFMEIANGEYKPKIFKQDIIETWQWNNCYDN
jgi:hypothetical protein